MEYYKKQKLSEETLIRKGDIVYRVNKSDGSGRGNFRSGGGGYSPHSDRRHGNSAVIEDLFHKVDDGDQMAKQELDKRGLWLDLRRSNVFAQPTGELLNQLELTRDFEPTRRMKERRKMLVAALMDRNEVLGEAFVNASSTEELHTMRSRYEAYGRPPHFTETARLINEELRNRSGNHQITLVGNAASTPSVQAVQPANAIPEFGRFVAIGDSNPAQRSNPLDQEIVDAINDASRQSGMPANLLKGQMAWENRRFNVNEVPRDANGVPLAGQTALGLMQVTRGARIDVNNEIGTSYTRSDLTDPRINALVGAVYWRILFEEAREIGASAAEAMKIASAGYFAGRTVTRTAVRRTKYAGQELTADNVISNIIPLSNYTLNQVRNYLSGVLRFSEMQ